MPEIELTAVFYVTIPDEVDPDDVTLEMADDGTVSFFANDEVIASAEDVSGWETEGVYVEDEDDDEDDEDEA
jgi:hypothetical protein